MRTTDIILTTSLHPISNAIRWFSAGKWFDTNIASHVGILLEISGNFFVAEMIYSPFKKMGLKLNSINKYMNNGVRGNQVVCIRRNNIYDDLELRDKARKRILDDLASYELGYDVKGIGSYVLPFIKDRSEKFYCSEYVVANWVKDGDNHYPNEKYTPYDLQKDPYLSDLAFIKKG